MEKNIKRQKNLTRRKERENFQLFKNDRAEINLAGLPGSPRRREAEPSQKHREVTNTSEMNASVLQTTAMGLLDASSNNMIVDNNMIKLDMKENELNSSMKNNSLEKQFNATMGSIADEDNDIHQATAFERKATRIGDDSGKVSPRKS